MVAEAATAAAAAAALAPAADPNGAEKGKQRRRRRACAKLLHLRSRARSNRLTGSQPRACVSVWPRAGQEAAAEIGGKNNNKEDDAA